MQVAVDKLWRNARDLRNDAKSLMATTGVFSLIDGNGRTLDVGPDRFPVNIPVDSIAHRFDIQLPSAECGNRNETG